MKILITGDLVINQQYDATTKIGSSLIDLFGTSDLNIVNLEAPVTKSKNKILKTGPHLKSNKDSTLSVFKALKIDLVTLANNHVLDYDEEGVLDTIAFCGENSIAVVGAGRNKKEASSIYYYDSPEGKIAIINLAENEWASASKTTAGSNGMDLLDDIKKMQEAKSKSDFVFVIVHGGHEYYNLPSPRMQKQYRFYIENGADIIVGHHPHCISGNEIYKGKHIYYSLGNFLFTAHSKYDDWYNGFVLQIEIKNGLINTSHISVKQDIKDFSLSLIKGGEKKEIDKMFQNYSNTIQNEIKLEEAWENFVNKRTKGYLNYWSPLTFINSRYIKGILRRLNLNFVNKKGLATYLNLMRCEAHRDISKEVVFKYLKK